MANAIKVAAVEAARSLEQEAGELRRREAEAVARAEAAERAATERMAVLAAREAALAEGEARLAAHAAREAALAQREATALERAMALEGGEAALLRRQQELDALFERVKGDAGALGGQMAAFEERRSDAVRELQVRCQGQIPGGSLY
jgi:hypothetical protein